MVPPVVGEVDGGVAVVGPVRGVVVVPAVPIVPVVSGVIGVAVGGVVPGVVVGVVPGVVVGVVPGVVVGVVPGVVEGVDVPVIPGVVADVPVVGGQSELVADGLIVPVVELVDGVVVVLGAVPVELGVVVPGVIVPVVVGQVLLCNGPFVVVEVGDGVVPDDPGAVVGELLVVVGIVGVVPCWEEFPVALPGAVVVGIAGVVPPVPGVCAVVMPMDRHTAAVNESTRVIMPIFSC